MDNEHLVFKPVPINEWPDMQALFEDCPFRGCWCMYWRSNRADFDKGMGEGNMRAMQQAIESGTVPGLLAYRDGKPVGWVSVGSREDFTALERSRVLKRFDDQPVWSIVCFLAAKSERGKGILSSLFRGAVKYAASKGASIVEVYPLIPEESRNPRMSSYMGMLSTFKKLGFQEVARPSRMRAVVRFFIQDLKIQNLDCQILSKDTEVVS